MAQEDQTLPAAQPAVAPAPIAAPKVEAVQAPAAVTPLPVAPAVAPDSSLAAQAPKLANAQSPETVEQIGAGMGVAVPATETVQPEQVFSQSNVQQATQAPADTPDFEKMSVDELAKEIAGAKSSAELRQADIMNRRIAKGVNIGQGAHESRLATARINAIAGIKNVKEQELARKEREEEIKYQKEVREEQRGFQKEDREFQKEDRAFQREMKGLDIQAKKLSLRNLANKGVDEREARQAMGEVERSMMEAPKGNDGFISPNDYSEQRARFVENALGSRSDFDAQYAGSLSQEERVNLGIQGGISEEFRQRQNTALDNLDTEQKNNAFKLQDDYVKQSKSFFTQRDAFNRIGASAEDPSAAGDMALIFNYMKVLDPGSTVREGEFATAQNAAGLDERIIAQYNKVITGERLSTDQRADFVDTAGRIFEGSASQQESLNATFNDRADMFGIPRSLVTQDIASASGSIPVSFELSPQDIQSIPAGQEFVGPDGQTYIIED